MDSLRVISLIAATITTGLMAGVFGLFQHTIMPGLAKTDDRTFVGAFQALDRAILNPWFMVGGFVGALLCTLLAGILQIGRAAFVWIAVAFVLYLIAFVVTIAIHVPLNDAIEKAGNPAKIDVASVRAQFDEARWAGWNLVRTITGTAAFGLLAWALTLGSRSS